MSIVLPTIDLSSIGSSFQVTPPSNLQASQIGWITLLNESPYTLTFQAGGMSLPIPAWDDYPIRISQQQVNGIVSVLGGFSLPITIMSQLLVNPGTSQSTSLIITFFSPGELPPNTVPRSLVRQTWIPNNVNTVGNNVSNILQNDGNAVPTQFLESTPGDAASSTWSFNNNGSGFVKGDNAGVLTQILQFVAGASPGLIFGNHDALGTTIDSTIGLNMKPDNDAHRAQVIAPNSATQSANLLEIYDNVPALQLAVGPLGQLTLNKSLNNNQAGTQINGGTSGTATLFQPFSGIALKLVLVDFNGFKTAASNQDIAIPSPFTRFAIILTGNIGNGQALNLLSGGVSQNVAIITTLAAAGGSGVLQNNFFGNTFASIVHAVDTFRITSGATGILNGPVLLIGI